MQYQKCLTIKTKVKIMENSEKIRKDLGKLRNDLCANIVNLLKKHDSKEVDVTDFDSTPIILEDLERCDYSYTLNRITADDYWSVRVEISNCEDDNTLTLMSLSTDVLFDLYEWLVENEEDIAFFPDKE